MHNADWIYALIINLTINTLSHNWLPSLHFPLFFLILIFKDDLFNSNSVVNKNCVFYTASWTYIFKKCTGHSSSDSVQTFPQRIAPSFMTSCGASLSATYIAQVSEATKLEILQYVPWECFSLPFCIHLTYLSLYNSSLSRYIYLLAYTSKMNICMCK